ncbi:MAG: hypothetical protein EKK64_11120 [Neisseriaceae bacterium]|nr:MAG: hypothetical protein EKK64_11120 [Neisseriaceae bacterium]
MKFETFDEIITAIKNNKAVINITNIPCLLIYDAIIKHIWPNDRKPYISINEHNYIKVSNLNPDKYILTKLYDGKRHKINMNYLYFLYQDELKKNSELFPIY